MEVLHNIKLDKYTTFKIGGKCKNLYIPLEEQDIQNIVKNNQDIRVISGGSNLLINDEKTFENVILLTKLKKNILNKGNGVFEVSASVPLPKFIDFINENEYGGIEKLFSIPGLVGGAIYMNAGTGMKDKCLISDYLISVRAICIKDFEKYKKNEIVNFSKEDCRFQWRSSIFHSNSFIILSAVFKFKHVNKKESERIKKERIKYVLEYQDRKKPNFGSVFSFNNKKIMLLFQKMSFQNKSICFSKKTCNWIVNNYGMNAPIGAFKKTVKLIKRVKFIHKLFRKKCKEEVIIWY